MRAFLLPLLLLATMAAAAPPWTGGVYRDRADYGTWFNNPDIYRMVVAEDRRGFYRGIGEFHVFGRDADRPVVKDIVARHSTLIDGYRKWLGQLPVDVAQRVAWRNGAELFGLE